MTELLPDESTAGKGTMSYLTPEDGDVRLSWEPGNAEDTATARRTFDDLRAKGYLAYRVTGRGPRAQRDQIRAFDPQAEQIVLAPPLRGG
jgi:hypothetical protein